MAAARGLEYCFGDPQVHETVAHRDVFVWKDVPPIQAAVLAA
jgi:hypothetical protein